MRDALFTVAMIAAISVAGGVAARAETAAIMPISNDAPSSAPVMVLPDGAQPVIIPPRFLPVPVESASPAPSQPEPSVEPSTGTTAPVGPTPVTTAPPVDMAPPGPRPTSPPSSPAVPPRPPRCLIGLVLDPILGVCIRL